ncbi:hypothetical protein GW17_00030365 [Ensete ventricosum]|nr:hypothetical protein GW17_00030365 [Ensete ventricosum]RZS28428.1 hypothetical protein BHM03_00062009 [Ensete ventricosum]
MRSRAIGLATAIPSSPHFLPLLSLPLLAASISSKKEHYYCFPPQFNSIKDDPLLTPHPPTAIAHSLRWP